MTAVEIPPFDPAVQQAIAAEIDRLAPLRKGFRHADLEFAWPNPQHLGKADLRAMAGLQDLFFTHHFSSHRRFLGPLIIAAKRFSTAVLNRLLKIVLVRQVELNQHNWNLALTVQILEQRVSELEQAQRDVKGHQP